MMKRVLVLSGSPRKGGNSDLLCDRFAEGARDAGHEAEKVFLRDKKIRYCLGCLACEEHGGRCAHKDDMAGILAKMLAADVIVMATPVYFYSMDAQLKTLIDRTYARYTEIRHKEMYFILSAADGRKKAMEPVLAGFRGFMACFDGMKEKGIVYGVGARDVGDIEKSRAMDRAYEMGRGV